MANNLKEKFFVRESGTIVRLTNDVIVHYLDKYGNWISNQYLFSMFVNKDDEYKEISNDELKKILDSGTYLIRDEEKKR